MSLDVNNLLTAIVTQVNTVTELGGKVGLDLVLDGTQRPYCRMTVIDDTIIDRSYGHHDLDSVPIQFSVFASDLAQANRIAKAVNDLLDRKTLTLSGQACVSAMRLRTNCRHEGRDQSGEVYHSLVVIEFRVSSTVT